ncbi:hypothetical protein T492DRAFT_605806, partial [Pavlovales sp. CCMP2436]
IAQAHSKAIRAGQLRYEDPASGYMVFSELASLGRGFCCGNACRHCPYGHAHVDPARRSNKIERSVLVKVTEYILYPISYILYTLYYI